MQNLKDMVTNSKLADQMGFDGSKDSSIHLHTSLSEVNHVKQLSADIGNLFNNTDYCDLIFVVEGVEFRVHKIILAARSDYFRALLFSGMRETNREFIEIKEAKPEAFRLLLQYIYTGKLQLRNEQEEVLIDLLSLVHQYGFIDLQKSISDFLESTLDVKNVCSIYDIACLYQLKSLEDTCARFIDKNCAVIIKHETIYQLSCESLAAIISRDSFAAPEIDIFNMVKKWHELNGIKEPKQILIDKIRLQLMKLEELLGEVRNSNLINSNTILDAIQLKTQSKDMTLRYRGVLYPDENIATSRYQAIVIRGEFKAALLDGDVINYDFDRGFTYHQIDDPSQHSIIVKLGNPSIFNQIKLLLWDKDLRSYSYYIEVSMNEEDWIRVIDYSDYMCRSWQNLNFKSVVAKFIKIVGVRNTSNRIFHLVSMEVRYTMENYDLLNGLIVPKYNIATIKDSACVLEGVSRTRNALINGDYKNYDWDSGYTCHQLGSGSINIQLAQPYILSSMRLLLWDCDNRSYSYYIETSLDQSKWTIVADKRNTDCKSWQILVFPPRPVSFIRIVGTHNTANEVFHCVHFECPCDPDVLNRYIEQESMIKPTSQVDMSPTPSSLANTNNHSMSIESNLTTINSSSMSSLSKVQSTWSQMAGMPTTSSAINAANNTPAIDNSNINNKTSGNLVLTKSAPSTVTNEVSDNMSNANRNSRSSTISENDDAILSDVQATNMEDVSTVNSIGNENVNKSTISLSEIDTDVDGPQPDN